MESMLLVSSEQYVNSTSVLLGGVRATPRRIQLLLPGAPAVTTCSVTAYPYLHPPYLHTPYLHPPWTVHTAYQAEKK